MPMPDVQPRYVLLRVIASGFNPIDTKIRAGLASIAADNHVIGCDVCGEVVDVGAGVTRFAVGDLVYGCVGGVKGSSGTLCRYMAADTELLAIAPTSIRPEIAAALPLVSITAFEALQRLNIQSDDFLLIMGASGGVGYIAAQLAKIQGALVTGTAGTEHGREKLLALGIEAISHSEVSSSGAKFTKALDTFGVMSFQRALTAVTAGGQVATINARNTYDLTQAHAKALTIHAIFMLLPLLTGNGRRVHGEFLTWLASAIDSGKVVMPFVEVLPAADVVNIHRRYESGELKHKVVFTL
jgi:NADPH2:quinone reductase